MTSGQDAKYFSLFPAWSSAEIADAEENIARYLAVVALIWERIRQDSAALAQLKALTEKQRGHTVRSKRSNQSGTFTKTS